MSRMDRRFAAQETPAEMQAPRLHDARDLVGKEGTARIVLDNQTYVLRITRAGKLILTK